jgi:hypothetical protein
MMLRALEARISYNTRVGKGFQQVYTAAVWWKITAETAEGAEGRRVLA